MENKTNNNFWNKLSDLKNNSFCSSQKTEKTEIKKEVKKEKEITGNIKCCG